MRLATLGLFHETNTFSPVLADYRRFSDGGVLRGREIVEQYANSSSAMAGFLAADAIGVDIEPLIFAFLYPTGTISEDAFETVVGEMLYELKNQGPWDGVLLALHGAAVAEHHRDADGEIAARVREVVGPDIPVGASLDMHANISRQLIDPLTITTVYQTNPHVDAKDRSLECADLVIRTARGEIQPYQALVPLPVVVNIARQDTNEPPMSELVAAAAEISRRPGMLSASVVEGFPYADVPHMGMSCLAVSDSDPAVADCAAQELAGAVWNRREELQTEGLGVEAALDIAERERQGPVVLLDAGDNIGGGAPGDSTAILTAAVRRSLPSLLVTLWDPQAVEACIVTGVGSTVGLTVGARHPNSATGMPVHVRGCVRLIADGHFEDLTSTHGGFRFYEQGTVAVLATTNGHTLVLTSRPVPSTSLQQLHSLGLDPARYHIVVAKGVNSPRAAYKPIASRMLVVDTDGVTAMGLRRFTYNHRRQPLYPLEQAVFPEAAG